MQMLQQLAQTWQLMVDLGVDIVNVDNVVAFRSFVVSNLYQRRWRRTLGPFGLDPGKQCGKWFTKSNNTIEQGTHGTKHMTCASGLGGSQTGQPCDQ